MQIDAEKLDVVHNVGAHRFQVQISPFLAVLEYEIEEDRIIFYHTEVPQELEGQGVANRMARVALEYAREKAYKVVPACEFIRVYVRRHPEYKNIVSR